MREFAANYDEIKNGEHSADSLFCGSFQMSLDCLPFCNQRHVIYSLSVCLSVCHNFIYSVVFSFSARRGQAADEIACENIEEN